MLYKEDWEKAKERFEALWNGEVVDRCCISVQAPRKGRENYLKEYRENVRRKQVSAMGALTIQHMEDPEYVLKQVNQVMKNIYYGGEAIPQIFMNYGPIGHAAYFDAPCHKDGVTTWYNPIVSDITRSNLKFNENNQILKWQIEAASLFAKEGKDKFLVSTLDNSGSLDALAALRGTEALLIDMLEEPDAVKKELKKLINAWKIVGDRMYDITSQSNYGGATIRYLSYAF